MENQLKTPLHALVEQVTFLQNNITKMLKQNGQNAVLSDYIVPILAALANGLDQSLVGLNTVAQTSQTALVTAEKTLAGEVLSSVSEISNDLSLSFADLVEQMSERLTDADKEKLRDIQDLLIELQETVEPWNDEDDEDDEDGEDDGDDDEDDEDDEDGEDDGNDEDEDEDEDDAPDTEATKS